MLRGFRIRSAIKQKIESGFRFRMKRDPLSFVLGTNRKKDVTKADGLVEVPIYVILTRPISVGRSFRPMTFHISLTGRKDLSGEIYRQIRRAILAGGCAPETACRPAVSLHEHWPCRA